MIRNDSLVGEHRHPCAQVLVSLGQGREKASARSQKSKCMAVNIVKQAMIEVNYVPNYARKCAGL